MPSALVDPPYRTDTTNTFSEESDMRNKNIVRTGGKNADLSAFIKNCEPQSITSYRTNASTSLHITEPGVWLAANFLLVSGV